MAYGGDVSPQECWDSLQENNDAVLIDVRTNAEWAFVGMPRLSEDMQPLIGQEWQVFPDMHVDTDFDRKLSQRLQAAGLDKQSKLYFICRSGARSFAAACLMTAFGYPHSYNVVAGFEGDLNEKGHRGGVNGWKADGLPWRQG